MDMRDDLFKKFVAAKSMELEYHLMCVYYREYTDEDKKPAFLFEQYAEIIKDISRCATGLCRSEDTLDLITAEQIYNLTSTLGRLFMQHLLKLQGKSLFEDFNDCVKDIFGTDLPDDFKEIFEDDTYEE